MGKPYMRLFLILTAIVSLSVIGVAAIVGIQVVRAGTGADSTPLMTAILGFLAPTVVALLTLARVENNSAMTEDTMRQVEQLKKDGFDPKEDSPD